MKIYSTNLTFHDKIDTIVREELQNIKNLEWETAITEFIDSLNDRLEELIQDEIYFSRRYKKY